MFYHLEDQDIVTVQNPISGATRQVIVQGDMTGLFLYNVKNEDGSFSRVHASNILEARKD